MGSVISQALINLLTIENLIMMNLGMFVGIIFGAIPGMNGNLAITVLLPFTFMLEPVPALLLLTAIFFGSNFGGSISAILINTPGTNAAAATLLDGYPCCRKGFPGKALSTYGIYSRWTYQCMLAVVLCSPDWKNGNELWRSGVFCTCNFRTFCDCLCQWRQPVKRNHQRLFRYPDCICWH